jgi:chemotaxis protein methyltransferase CheR
MSSATARQKSGESSLVEGEFHFTTADFKRISKHLYDMAGIALPESKSTLVYSRLAKRLRALQLESFAQYCQLIEAESGQDESYEMMRALTTNVTRFYREPHHFEHLREHVIVPRIAGIKAGNRMRLWSAASSTGQEPYSMAITLLETFPEASRHDVKILATDIDSNVLTTGRKATYSEELLEGISPAQKQKWFERDGSGAWRVNETVRRMVSFNELNLLGQWPMKGHFDAIFCRNVVIYFDEPTQEQVWKKFANVMIPGSMLYVGHSERVGYSGSPFITDGLTSYRKGPAS